MTNEGATRGWAGATPEAAGRAAEVLLGCGVARVEPSRRRRGLPAESFRVWLDDGRAVIATRRSTATRTAFEAHVLRTLGERSAVVPQLLAAEGGWLMQEDLGSLRLSMALANAEPREARSLLDLAIDGLVAVHRAGREAELDHDAPTLAAATSLLDSPGQLAERCGVPLPGTNATGLQAALSEVAPNAFVKGDARPARAQVSRGTVRWFSWARCGRGHRLHDLIGLLGDEAIPDWPELEAALLDAHLPRFITSLDRGRTRFAVYGVMHLCSRMRRILELRDEAGDWWPAEECLDADHPIVTADAFERLRVRALRWSKRHVLTSPLARLFQSLG